MPKVKELIEEKKESKKSKTQTEFQSLENLFNCVISLERMENPVLTKCCANTLDESNLIKLKECPLCRKPIGYMPNRQLKDVITESLVVKEALEENEQRITKIANESKNQNIKLTKSLKECENQKAGLADVLHESHKENDRLAKLVDEFKIQNAMLVDALQESHKEKDFLFSTLKNSMRHQMRAAQPKQQKWWQHPAVALTTCFIAGGAVSYLMCWSKALQLAQSPALFTNPTPANNNTGIINPALLQELVPATTVLPHVSTLFCYSNKSSVEDLNTNLLSDKGFTVPVKDIPQHSSAVDIKPVTAENNLKPIQDTGNNSPAKEQAEFLYRYADKVENKKRLLEIQQLRYKAERYKSHSYIWDPEKKTWNFPEFTLADRQRLEKNTYDLADAIEQELIPAIKEDFPTGSFRADRTPKEHAEALRENFRAFLKQIEIISDAPKKSKNNAETNHVVTSPSSVLLSPLKFNNSQPYASFEDDKVTTQSIFDELYSKNRMFKCKMDAIFESKRFHIKFIPQDSLEKNALDNTHFGKVEFANMNLSLFRGVKKNIETQREILREIEYVFVANDNFIQRQAFDISPFGKNFNEYRAYKTAVESDLRNIKNYFNLTKANAKLSSDERRKLNRLKIIAKDYEAMSFKKEIVDENYIQYGLAQGSIDKYLRWIVPQEFKEEHDDDVYIHHFEKKNDKYIMYASPSPFGFSKVQSLLCDALYILKAVQKKSITLIAPYAQMFGVYPGLIEILIPAIIEYEIQNRHSSYRTCLGK